MRVFVCLVYALFALPAAAQTTSGIDNALSTLSAFGAGSGADLGRRVANGIYADDPAASEAIVDWYDRAAIVVPPRPTTTVAAPRGLPSDLGDLLNRGYASDEPQPPGSRRDPLPAPYLAVIESHPEWLAFDRSPRDGIYGLPGSNIAQNEVASAAPDGLARQAGGCTIESVVRAYHRLYAFLEPGLGEALKYDVIFEGLSEKATTDLYGGRLLIGPVPGLALRRDFDELVGTNYWSARWLQEAAARTAPDQRAMVHYVYGTLVGRAHGAAAAANDAALHGQSHHPLDLATKSEFYAPVAAFRREHLRVAKQTIDDLRGAGCGAQADFVHVDTARVLAVGDEWNEYQNLDEAYWNAYGQSKPSSEPQEWAAIMVRDDFVGDMSGVIFGRDRVDSVLGPLPALPTGQDDGSSAASRGNNERPAFNGRQGRAEARTGTDDADGHDGPDSADQDSWDIAGPTTDEPKQDEAVTGGTWLSASGFGRWPQTTLAGFWKTQDIDDSLITLIKTDRAGRHFDGLIVTEEGRLSGSWLDMDREGDSDGWRGRAHIALLEPKGACPHWTTAAFLIKPAAASISGAWTGKRYEPEGCIETDEPDGGPIRLERLVATAFKPLIPGKFIHLVGVPAGGSTAAQYKAAVAFACDVAGLPVASQKVTVSAGDVVEQGEACSYQLVVDRPGGYDITVEFSDDTGAVIHTDNLHADIPPIPGLTG